MDFTWWFCIIFNIGGIGYGVSKALDRHGPFVRYGGFAVFYLFALILVEVLIKKFGISNL